MLDCGSEVSVCNKMFFLIVIVHDLYLIALALLKLLDNCGKQAIEILLIRNPSSYHVTSRTLLNKTELGMFRIPYFTNLIDLLLSLKLSSSSSIDSREVERIPY